MDRNSVQRFDIDLCTRRVNRQALNKWEGISFIAKRHGIHAREVIAIGDDLNDLHMLKHSGLGIAMGNARPALKAVADRVIGANTEDGLAAFLEELLGGDLDEAA
jgi:hydroxymethylpyrimidine pyrophosphatase-like HAD family hydrolase